MGEQMNSTPCEPASPRRCLDSGSGSVKYATGHECTSNQVHRGNQQTTGRHWYHNVTKTCRYLFLSCFTCRRKKRYVNNPCRDTVVPTDDDVVAVDAAPRSIDDTANGEQESPCRDAQFIVVPTDGVSVEEAAPCSIDDDHDTAANGDNVSSEPEESRDAQQLLVVVPTDGVSVDEAAPCSIDDDVSSEPEEGPCRDAQQLLVVVPRDDDVVAVDAANGDNVSSPEEQPSSSSPEKRVIRVFHKPVELHHATQPWKARKDRSANNDVTRKAKAILNKISPDNFDKLTRQLKDLNVDNEDDARNLANVLFQKAAEDQTYAYLYAKLCRHLMWSFYVTLEVSDPEELQHVVNFRFVLAAKAKENFKKVLADLQGDPSAYQRRYNRGLMNFVAELVNHNVLNLRVGSDIIKAMLNHFVDNNITEPSIDCFVTFLNVAGKTLDFPATVTDKPRNIQKIRQQAKFTMDVAFDFLKELLTYPKGLISRQRFMVADLTSLRDNLWVKKKRQ